MLTELVMNVGIFLAFFACCTLHHWIEHKKHPTPGQSVSHVIWAGIFNPASIDSVKDFLAHLLVYSGYVIPPH